MRSYTLAAALSMLSIAATSPTLAACQTPADPAPGAPKPGPGQGNGEPTSAPGIPSPMGAQNPTPPANGGRPGGLPGFGGLVPPSACAVWSIVAADLVRNVITDSDGTLTPEGRSAIRLVFHDCFPGACDGSVVLAGECKGRIENFPLQNTCEVLGDKASQYNVGTADIIQLAGALAVKASGGPALAFKTGRADSSTANPTGQLPGRNDPAQTQVAVFQAKGFTAAELVVLVGAHTVGRAALQGVPLDSTPNKFDNAFYNNTAAGFSAAAIGSDVSLARSPSTAPLWRAFGSNGKEWRTEFTAAMAKLSLMGTKESSLEDCSSVVTDAFSSLAARSPTQPNSS